MVEYNGMGSAKFENQIVVKSLSGPTAGASSFADFGDSGAVVVNEWNFAVGLLFAVSNKSPKIAWVNPMEAVLNALSVRVWEYRW